MNRAEQLKAALESCLNSSLPKEVEFIIIDNASTDDTKSVVDEVFNNTGITYLYEYQKKNLGVGGGRNRGFELASGDYVYFMDDDAVIEESSYNSFFVRPIEAFENDTKIASITTRIYDEMLSTDRDVEVAKHSRNADIKDIFMYLGGSHFMRRSYFNSPLYLDVHYGMEEILPSIMVLDKGYRNCYIHSICLLHQPRKNKWISGTDQLKKIVVNANVNLLRAKKKLYPWYMHPIINLTFWIRNIKHLGFDMKMLKEAYQASHLYADSCLSVKKIKFRTIISIACDYPFRSLL